MATFTHTITWLANIEGKAVTYTFDYDIEDVDDIERYSVGRQAQVSAVFRSEPVFFACLVSVSRAWVSIQESAGPTALTAWSAEDGDLVVFHQSDTGGTWNSSGSDATTTLRTNDQVAAGTGASYAIAGIEVMVLHQPAS